LALELHLLAAGPAHWARQRDLPTPVGQSDVQPDLTDPVSGGVAR
jgi:hypothetical protein